MNFKSIAILLLLVIPAGFAGIWRLQHSIDAQMSALHEEQDEVLLSSTKVMKAMSLEYAPLVADIYWTRVVQYYGSRSERRQQALESLWPLLDLATTLDPNLLPAYRFGSTFLAEPRPAGAGQPERAVELIKRGIKENPEQWRLYQDLGNVYYFALKDNEKASQAYVDGSKVSGAAPWMKLMAARIAERGDTRETSRYLWTEIFQSSQDPSVKENAKVHLILLKVDDDLEHLNALLDEFAKRARRRAENMSDLIDVGMLPGFPADPDGFAYVIGASGKAEINPKSPLLEKEKMYRRF
jgi:tetratricopeptide (TPR) repeat protein